MSTVPTVGEPRFPSPSDNLGTGWNHFWFAPVDPTLLGVIRICCGVVALYIQIVNAIHLQDYLGADAWIDLPTLNSFRLNLPTTPHLADWENPSSNGQNSYPTEFRSRNVWSIWFHVTDPKAMERVQMGILAVTVLFLLGFWSRVTCALTWLGFMGFVHRADTMTYGMDTMVHVILLYLMLAPCGAALSIDSFWDRFWSRRSPVNATTGPAASSAANFCLRLLQIHLCIVYFVSGLAKVQGACWWSGEVLWYPLVNYELSPVSNPIYAGILRWLINDRGRGELTLAAGVALTMFVEIGFPFLVWLRRWRYIMILGALFLHVGIGLLVGLPMFGMIMGTLVLSFLPPEDVRRFFSRLSGNGTRNSPAA